MKGSGKPAVIDLASPINDVEQLAAAACASSGKMEQLIQEEREPQAKRNADAKADRERQQAREAKQDAVRQID